MTKTLSFLAALSLGGVLAYSLVAALDTPVVYRQQGDLVACQTPDMAKHAPIDTPACQTVLKGSYDLVEVGPEF